MFDANLQHGFLFNQAPSLICKAMNNAESNSDLLVKMARFCKGDKNITHDHQPFREYRSTGHVTMERIGKYFDSTLSTAAFDEEYEPETLGAWYICKQVIKSFAQRSPQSGPLTNYWSYLDAHCDLDRKFFVEAKAQEGVSLFYKYLNNWLDMDIESGGSELEQNDLILSYIVRLVLYWAALLELYLELEYGNDKHSKLQFMLPSIKQKNRLSLTSEMLFFRLKSRWAELEYKKPKITNETLYKDILKKQCSDDNIDTSDPNNPTNDNVSPYTETMRKRFQRYRKGQLFTYKGFQKDIAILSRPYAEEWEPQVYIPFLLVNLFTLMQMELLESKACPKKIEKEFSRYPKYKVLVKNRFNAFLDSGELAP